MDNNNCTHHWIIDSENVGRCKYCPAVKDFGKLQGRESKLLSLTAKSGGTKGKRGRKPEGVRILSAERSAAAKKRWQNPEYRAKMGGRKLAYKRNYTPRTTP